MRRRARPDVVSQHMQRIQAVEKHVAIDSNVAGNDAVAGFLMCGVEQKDRSPPRLFPVIGGCVLFQAEEAQEGPRQHAAACMFEAFFERRAAIALTEIR